MPTLRRNGVNIYYEMHGQGPTLLLTHGYSATSKMWRGQIEPLSKKYRVVICDMRGHGQTDYPEDQALYSEAETIADMAMLIDVAGPREAIIAGLSLGGYMSLAFQLAHPERTRGLMLFDTGPGYRSDDARNGWNKTAL